MLTTVKIIKHQISLNCCFVKASKSYKIVQICLKKFLNKDSDFFYLVKTFLYEKVLHFVEDCKNAKLPVICETLFFVSIEIGEKNIKQLQSCILIIE